MILKMKKFVIQWRKFESKMSYINEDVNFLILWNLFGFYFHFSRIFGFIYLLKSTKKILFVRDPRR